MSDACCGTIKSVGSQNWKCWSHTRKCKLVWWLWETNQPGSERVSVVCPPTRLSFKSIVLNNALIVKTVVNCQLELHEWNGIIASLLWECEHLLLRSILDLVNLCQINLSTWTINTTSYQTALKCYDKHYQSGLVGMCCVMILCHLP